MQERLRGYYFKVIDKWKSLSRTQKIRFIATVVLLIITLVASITITTRPKLSTIVSNRDYTEIAKIKAALDAAGIASTEKNGGTALTVNERDKDKAAITIATSGSLSTIPNFTYQDALDASGMGTTDLTKRENNRRVYNTDLSQKLQLIDGIEHAAVEITFPDSANYYIESQQKASASVVLTLSRVIDKVMGERLARFLKASVKGLELENIEILSTNFDTIYSGSQISNGTSGVDLEVETLRKQELDKNIKAALGPLVDEVRAIPNIVILNDAVKEKTQSYSTPLGSDSASGLIANEDVNKTNIVNANPDAVPGVDANDMTAQTYQTGAEGESNVSINEKKVSYLYDAIERSVDYAVGDIDQSKSSLLVMTYKYKRYYEKHMTDNNLLGDLTWQQFIDANSSDILLPSDENYEQLKAGLIIGTGINNLSLLQYEVPVFYDYVEEPFQVQQLIMFGILAFLILLLAYELIKKAQPDEITEVEPELSVEDLLVSTQLEEEKIAEEERLKMLEFGEDSQVKQLIEKFITERPEAVAQLMRNWLNDEWE